MRIEANSIDYNGKHITKGDKYYTCNSFDELKDKYDTWSDTSFVVDKIEVETSEFGEDVSLIEIRYPYDRSHAPYNLYKVFDNLNFAKKLYFEKEDGHITAKTYKSLQRMLEVKDSYNEKFEYESEIERAILHDKPLIDKALALKEEILKGMESKEISYHSTGCSTSSRNIRRSFDVRIDDPVKYMSSHEEYYVNINCGDLGYEISDSKKKDLVALKTAINIMEESNG